MRSVAVLSGGVGGARLARGFYREIGSSLTVVVNVGDDETVYGVHVSPDVDTVVYTLAEREGPQGWGLAGDTSAVMDQLEERGVDTSFRLGDADLATCLVRTMGLRAGRSLSAVTAAQTEVFGVGATVLPATDDRLRTRLRTADGEWLGFQDYFVRRRHRDVVIEVEFDGAPDSKPADGVLDALATASMVVIAPSNPPLSIWPILAVPGIRDAVAAAGRVIAVSPLFGGEALKGPAADVMASLRLPSGNAGVVAAYAGLITDLVVDVGDAADAALASSELAVHVMNTRFADPVAAAGFAAWLLELAS